MTLPLLLAVGLLGWSLLGNLVLGDRYYVSRGLLLGALLLVVARGAGADAPALGIDGGALGAGLRWGGLVVVVVAVAVGLGTRLADRLPGVGALLADERAASLSGRLVAWHALWRIPVGTALVEELAFRGVLLGLLRAELDVVGAVTVASVTFGLWHIAPTMVTLRANRRTVASRAGLGAIGGAVLATTAAGVALSVLRLGSGSLLAPVLAHWATNALGLVAAAGSRSEGA